MSLFEQPFLIGGIGLVLTILLAKAWLSSGQNGMLVGAVLSFLLTLGLLAAERIVETDREVVTQQLYTMAELLEQNEIDRLIDQFAHQDASERMLDQIRLNSRMYNLDKVEIKRNLEVEAHLDYEPPEVRATFNVLISGSSAQMSGQAIRFIKATFRKDETQEWRLYDGSHHDINNPFAD